MTNVEQFRKFQAALNGAFVDRAHVARGITLALLTGQHVVLLGPPGTAKSAIARATARLLGLEPSQPGYYEQLLTRFTPPEAVFGPLKLSALEQDRYERATEGTLVDAKIAFLDEAFKASPAILNSLLTALNERLFHNGSAVQRMPLATCIAASNEGPEDGLQALWDRFVFRYVVANTTTRGAFDAVFDSEVEDLHPVLSMDDVASARVQVSQLTWSAPARDALFAIRTELKASGIHMSDRKVRQAKGIGQASAWLAGASDVSPSHLKDLSDVLWDVAPGPEHLAVGVNPLREKVEDVVKKHTKTGMDDAVALVDVFQAMAEQTFHAAVATDERSKKALENVVNNGKQAIKRLKGMAGEEGIVAEDLAKLEEAVLATMSTARAKYTDMMMQF